MRSAFLATTLAAAVIAGPAAKAENQDHLLRGTFSITGTDTCVVSFGGFDAQLRAQPLSFTATSSIIGTRIFNGDGTGFDEGTAVTNNVTPGAPTTSASSANHFSFDFTYTVAPDRTVTLENDGPLTGTVLTGAGAGETFTIDHFSQTGKLSLDHQTITLAVPAPQVEVLTLSTGVVEHRICTTSRVLIKVENDTDHDLPGER